MELEQGKLLQPQQRDLPDSRPFRGRQAVDGERQNARAEGVAEQDRLLAPPGRAVVAEDRREVVGDLLRVFSSQK